MGVLVLRLLFRLPGTSLVNSRCCPDDEAVSDRERLVTC